MAYKPHSLCSSLRCDFTYHSNYSYKKAIVINKVTVDSVIAAYDVIKSMYLYLQALGVLKV